MQRRQGVIGYGKSVPKRGRNVQRNAVEQGDVLLTFQGGGDVLPHRIDRSLSFAMNVEEQQASEYSDTSNTTAAVHNDRFSTAQVFQHDSDGLDNRYFGSRPEISLQAVSAIFGPR